MRRALAAAPDAALGYGSWAGRRGCRPSSPRTSVGRAASLCRRRHRRHRRHHPGDRPPRRVLRARGARRVLVEEPGFWQHRTILQRAGLELVLADVDDGGLRTDALPAAAAALVTPAHQFPTGAVLAPGRRAALLDWATAHEALVIEDDYDGEYRYDRDPLGALQGLGAGRVVTSALRARRWRPRCASRMVLPRPSPGDRRRARLGRRRVARARPARAGSFIERGEPTPPAPDAPALPPAPRPARGGPWRAPARQRVGGAAAGCT